MPVADQNANYYSFESYEAPGSGLSSRPKGYFDDDASSSDESSSSNDRYEDDHDDESDDVDGEFNDTYPRSGEHDGVFSDHGYRGLQSNPLDTSSKNNIAMSLAADWSPSKKNIMAHVMQALGTNVVINSLLATKKRQQDQQQYHSEESNDNELNDSANNVNGNSSIKKLMEKSVLQEVRDNSPPPDISITHCEANFEPC